MPRPLEQSEIEAELQNLDGWSVTDGILNKEFSFGSYLDGLAFAQKVGELAETLNHHPDILILWRRVRLSVLTHSVQAISELDFELARGIEAL